MRLLRHKRPPGITEEDKRQLQSVQTRLGRVERRMLVVETQLSVMKRGAK